MSVSGRIAVLMLLFAPSAALGAEPISQFHLAPNTRVTTKVKVRAGKVYPMVISGTQTNLDSQHPSESEPHDTFYCFQGTPKTSCPDMPRPGASVYPSPSPDDLLPMGESVDGGQIPAYSPDHTYSFGYKARTSGTLVMTTQPNCGRCTGEGFDIKIFAPEGPVEPCAGARAHTAADNEVRIVALKQSVQVHKAGTPEDAWVDACKDTVLQQGDEISCDPDGSVTLQFADNSTAVIFDTTQLKIASFFTEGGVDKTLFLLQQGRILAKLPPKDFGRPSDFRIKSPTGTASVRGTVFSVSYDPGSRSMLTTTQEGVVEVDPDKAGLPTVQVPAGKEVEVTSSAMSKVVAAGKAGARNGVGRFAALDRVLKIVARANGPCKVSTPRTGAFAVKPVSGGWAVAVKLTGKHKGTARWTVKGKRTRPANALAKRVSKRCN
jgi:hypothetical protein